MAALITFIPLHGHQVIREHIMKRGFLLATFDQLAGTVRYRTNGALRLGQQGNESEITWTIARGKDMERTDSEV
jgi:hypothetical protein